MIADLDEEKGKQAIVDLTREFGRGKVAFIRTDVSDGPEFESRFYYYTYLPRYYKYSRYIKHLCFEIEENYLHQLIYATIYEAVYLLFNYFRCFQIFVWNMAGVGYSHQQRSYIR